MMLIDEREREREREEKMSHGERKENKSNNFVSSSEE